jgi:hypothetical protein
VPDDVGPGKLDQVSAAGRVAEHPEAYAKPRLKK